MTMDIGNVYGMLTDLMEGASSMLGSLFYAAAIVFKFENSAFFMALLVVLILVGLFFCFLGYRFRRVVSALMGALGGFLLTTIVYMITNPDLSGEMSLIIALVAAVVVGILCFRFQKVGIFLFCLTAVGPLCFLLMYSPLDFLYDFPVSSITMPALVGLVYAILAMKWTRPLLILSAAAFGGVLAGGSAAIFVGVTSYNTAGIIMLVLAVAGAALQWTRSQPKAAAQPAAAGAVPQQPVMQQPVMQQPVVQQPVVQQPVVQQPVQPAETGTPENPGQPQG